MRKINLLAKLPRGKRNVCARAEAKTEQIIAISREYGQLYFDGPRTYGYGGYRYDGRWIPVAEDMVKHFGLKPGDRVLDVGCAKGFLVKDLLKVCPGLEAIWPRYFRIRADEMRARGDRPLAPRQRHQVAVPGQQLQDAVISLNTVHNLERSELIMALREIERLAPGRGFVQVDSYRTPEQKALFEEWVLTAKFHDYPDGWISLFKEAGYTGDYYWTIIE